jgi:GNAT superfamily N-acetyltransferase
LVTTGGRRTISDARGTSVATYLPKVRDGRSWADRVEVLGPDPAGPILDQLPGWAVTCPVGLAERLVELGATVLRRAVRMCRDLVDDPPPAAWAQQRPVSVLRLATCDRPAADLLPTWRAAYPATHPDHFDGDDETALRVRLVPQLAGHLHGRLMPLSTLVTDAADRVVAGVVVNDMDSEPPWHGPWITDLFRHPAPAYAGLGTLLLRRVLAHGAREGLPTVSLVVTEENPARRVYTRHGFRIASTTTTVLIPDGEESRMDKAE